MFGLSLLLDLEGTELPEPLGVGESIDEGIVDEDALSRKDVGF